MEERRTTSAAIVQQYLTRIALYEDRFNATLHVNPNALKEAEERDKERAAGKVRGPLHGIPIALKDNIHTTDMPTTGGAVAFEGLMPPVRRDAHEEPARRRRDHHRQDQPDRARQLGRRRADADARQLHRAQRLRPQPLRPATRSARADRRRTAGAEHRRIELRRRHRRQLLGCQRRHRNLGVDPEPGQPEHARRDQADGWPHQPLRRDSNHRRPGHRRADGEVRRRCRAPARRARKRVGRSQRPGDDPLHAAGQSRLHAAPQGRWAERRAHRHSPRVLLHARPHRQARPSRAAGSTPISSR